MHSASAVSCPRVYYASQKTVAIVVMLCLGCEFIKKLVVDYHCVLFSYLKGLKLFVFLPHQKPKPK